MSDIQTLVPLLEALKAALDWLDDSGVARAVVGGVAASIYGRPRATRDIDLVAIADEGRWPELITRATQFGIVPRQTDTLDFARITRVMLLEHRPTAVEIDLSIAGLAFENEMITAARLVQVAGVSIPVARPEDIMIMKCLALRPRDIADIEGILQVQKDLDLSRIRSVIATFSEVLEQADFVAQFDQIVKRVLPSKR